MFQKLLGSTALNLFVYPLKCLADLSMVGQRAGHSDRCLCSGLAWPGSCTNMPWRVGKDTAGQRLLSLIYHHLLCRWPRECCSAQGNAVHDPGAQPRENVPIENTLGTRPFTASRCGSFCYLEKTMSNV